MTGNDSQLVCPGHGHMGVAHHYDCIQTFGKGELDGGKRTVGWVRVQPVFRKCQSNVNVNGELPLVHVELAVPTISDLHPRR